MVADPHVPAAVQAEPLTQVLCRAGSLTHGRVRGVTVANDRPTLISRIVRLRLEYDQAPEAAPRTLILKTSKEGSAGSRWGAGEREVAFYREVAPLMPVGCIPRCFAAYADEATGDWHLLLQDLSDSHFIATEWPLPPSTPQCERIVEGLAALHAAWWDHPRLGVDVGAWRDAAGVRTYLATLATQFAGFRDRLGDLLTSERQRVYERFLDRGEALFARLATRRNVTVIHGDAHAWNVFLPRDAGSEVRFFDWDAWSLLTT